MSITAKLLLLCNTISDESELVSYDIVAPSGIGGPDSSGDHSDLLSDPGRLTTDIVSSFATQLPVCTMH